MKTTDLFLLLTLGVVVGWYIRSRKSGPGGQAELPPGNQTADPFPQEQGPVIGRRRAVLMNNPIV